MEINITKLFFRIIVKYHIEQFIKSPIVFPVCFGHNEAIRVGNIIDYRALR